MDNKAIKVIDITPILSVKRATNQYKVKLNININGRIIAQFNIDIEAINEEMAFEKAVESVDNDLEFELEEITKV